MCVCVCVCVCVVGRDFRLFVVFLLSACGDFDGVSFVCFHRSKDIIELEFVPWKIHLTLPEADSCLY